MRLAYTNRLASFLREASGAAAAEFALVAVMFAYMLVNVGDLGIYVYDKMQVESAAQAAAESMWAQCNPATGGAPDVTGQCSSYATYITTGAQQTSLTTSVSASIPKSPGEGWYCTNTTGGLTRVSNISTTQPACKATVSANASNAGDYVPITATYTYSPLFPHATVTSLLSTTITQTVWIRVY